MPGDYPAKTSPERGAIEGRKMKKITKGDISATIYKSKVVVASCGAVTTIDSVYVAKRLLEELNGGFEDLAWARITRVMAYLGGAIGQ
jgi:hypothetical protein